MRLEALLGEPLRQTEDVREGLRAFREKRKPELEVYSTAFLNNVWTLRNLGLLQEPLLVNLVTNIPGECNPWSPKNILFLVESLPPNSRWMVTAIGGRCTLCRRRFVWPWAATFGWGWKITCTSSSLGQLSAHLMGMLVTGSRIAIFSEVDPVQKPSIPSQRIAKRLLYLRSTLDQGIVGRYAEQDRLGTTVPA